MIILLMTVSIFFREAIFVPYLDHLVVEMEDRFLIRSRSVEVFGA